MTRQDSLSCAAAGAEKMAVSLSTTPGNSNTYDGKILVNKQQSKWKVKTYLLTLPRLCRNISTSALRIFPVKQMM